MARRQSQDFPRHDPEERAGELSDEKLVEQYLRRGETDSEDAFNALVKRHGPTVLGICRFVLDDEADAEDAFQATFLILTRKVASIRNRAILATWLHEVAYRTAVKARVNIDRRHYVERQNAFMLTSLFVPDTQHHDATLNELRFVLHHEIRRLPIKYRLPVILSYLEGKTNQEVAEVLQWPIGTVKVRLMRARELLRLRLTRRGMSLSVAFLITVVADSSLFAEVVPQELVERTLLVVKEFNPRSAQSGSLSRSVQPLIKSSGRGRIDILPFDVRKHPKLLLVLLAILSASMLTGIAVRGHIIGGNSSFLRVALSFFVPGQSSGAGCH